MIYHKINKIFCLFIFASYNEQVKKKHANLSSRNHSRKFSWRVDLQSFINKFKDANKLNKTKHNNYKNVNVFIVFEKKYKIFLIYMAWKWRSEVVNHITSRLCRTFERQGFCCPIRKTAIKAVYFTQITRNLVKMLTLVKWWKCWRQQCFWWLHQSATIFCLTFKYFLCLKSTVFYFEKVMT